MEKINVPYDYLINGNLGVNGQQRIIDEFNHQPENTLYLVQDKIVNQDIEQVKSMIFKNYKKIDKIGLFLVYQQPSITN